MKICLRCQKEFDNNRRKYCSKECLQRDKAHRYYLRLKLQVMSKIEHSRLKQHTEN